MEGFKISPELLASAGASTVDFGAGNVIFKTHKMYVVLSGEVEIL